MIWLLVIALGVTCSLQGQTTQSSLQGVIQDSVDGHVLANVTVQALQKESGLTQETVSDEHGEFVLLALSPGQYRLRVTADGYQGQVLDNLDVPVASRIELPFRLRPSTDVFAVEEQRNQLAGGGQAVLPLIGPDLSPGLEVSLAEGPLRQDSRLPVFSSVIPRDALLYLPLRTRDAYAALAVLGGVNSDAGSGRSLGLTVSGQRPTSSSFLLDGLTNNNFLTTGPGIALAPEALEEYRVSMAQYSAEYGGTSGYLANAVTRSPTAQWHGLIYSYLRNRSLDANAFQQNRLGVSRPNAKATQPGLLLTGPLFGRLGGIALYLESYRSQDQNPPQQVELPVTGYSQFTESSSAARQLLDRFQAPLPTTASSLAAPVAFRPRIRMDRFYGGIRADQRLLNQRLRLVERVLVNRLDRPDFIATPYPDFNTPLRQDYGVASVAASWTPNAHLLHEARVGLTQDRLSWNRAWPDIPTLTVQSAGNIPVVLPGSPAAYSYDNANRTWQLNYSLTGVEARHQWKTGIVVRTRRNSGALTFGQDGRLLFPGLLSFFVDQPSSYQIGVDRMSLSDQAAPYQSAFRMTDIAGYVQDEWHLTPKLIVSTGLRYETFGAPKLLGGTTLTTVSLGEGGSLPSRIAAAALQRTGAGGSAYTSDWNNVAIRTGLSYRLFDRGPVIRAAYGIYYDRPFDNLWQNIRSNAVALDTVPVSGQLNYLDPNVIASLPSGQRSDFPNALLIQPGLRTPYVHNYFVGISNTFAESWQWEVSGLGSLGRKLITTDRINRPFSLPSSGTNPTGAFNPDLGTIVYRGNQGLSSYNGLNLTLRRQSQRWILQLSYTWSHSIDNQSDPLAGDYLDLNFTGLQSTDLTRGVAAFSNQFDSSGDRGNSAFDQRHNLVLLSSWRVPSLGRGTLEAATRGWRISTLAAVRSGQPFTVFAPASAASGNIYNRRADYLGGATAGTGNVAGGAQYLNPGAFGIPTLAQGSLGRNSLYAAGFYSLDVSLAKTFSIATISEAFTVTVRADAFNLLNHANLSSPANLLGATNFGQATYGRSGEASSFPALTPLNESPRQMQLGLRIAF